MKRTSGLRLVSSVLLLCGLQQIFFQEAVAQQGSRPPESNYTTDWNERLNPNIGLKTHNDKLLGDQIDLTTGRLSFEQVDVSLPGNSSLPVELRRRRNPSQSYNNEFQDWQLLAPTISTKIMYSEYYNGVRWGKARCSASPISTIPDARYTYYLAPGSNLPLKPYEYSDGVSLDVPGVSSSRLLSSSGGNWPAGTQRGTTDGWYFTCLSNIDGNGTEGFIGHAPNGDRYTFNVMRWRKTVAYSDAWSIYYSSLGASTTYIQEGIGYDVLAASEVTDVNGNWVRYSYDANGKLTSIYANDGRRIDIGYSTAGKVTSVVANPGTSSARQWTYQYGTKTALQFVQPAKADGLPSTGTATYQTLTSVTLPNGRQWLYNLAGLYAAAIPGTNYLTIPGNQPANCTQQNQTVSVTHPDGITGEFVLQERPAFIVLRGVPRYAAACPNSTQGKGPNTNTDVMSVTRKTLTAQGVASTWSFSYVNGDTTEGAGFNKTTINLPDGSKQVNTYTRPAAYTALVKEETFPTVSSTTAVQTVEHSYLLEAASAGSDFVTSNTDDVSQPLRKQLTTITRGSDWYKTQNTYVTDRTLANYSWGSPTQISQWSSLGSGTRTTDITYLHDKTNWILGLPGTLTKNGKLFDNYSYDTSGRLSTHQRFGVTLATLGYYTSGTQAGNLNWYRDALGRQTTFANWYRSAPRTITRADNTSVSFSIDDNGWVKSKTDARNTTTFYAYDGIGRLTQIVAAPWNPTDISYSYSGGYLYQTATHGSEQSTTTYDAMLRPIQVLRQALSGGGDSIYTNTSYDPLGRVVFTSLPSTSAGATTGMATTYDALGRVTKKREAAPGAGITFYAYLAGNQLQITDQEGNITTNTKSGFGSPEDGDLIQSTKPNGVSASYSFDIYGDLLSLTQAKGDGTNTVSTFAYDARNRLCRRHIPENGDVLYAYDDANQMSGYAEGQGSGSGCASLPSSATVSLGYDVTGRLLTTTYPNPTPSISRSYDANGNLQTINRGGANWTYAYNNLNALQSETLGIDGRTYQTSYGYNDNGALTSRVYPSGQTYYYPVDGYGRPTNINNGSTTFLQNISYHPNGKINQLTRGNGGLYQQTLNARQLVSAVGGNWGTSLNYAYDLSGRINQITSPNSQYNRSFGYDGAGRLTSASGSWGTGSYAYDALGNIKQSIYGSRTVDVQYNTLNQVANVRDSAVSSNWRSYAYDSRGNVIGDGKHNFNYDDANQPVSISGNDNGSYTYDGNLKRVKEVVNGETLYSVYDKSGALITIDNASSGKKSDYLTLSGQTFVRIANGVASYPLNDAQGTAYMVADANGNISATYNYTPFGEALGTGPGSSHEQGYTGHVEDKTGLTYMQARYYDPVVGRFLSTDPIGYKDQLNLYAYVGNDPVNHTDPSGMQTFGIPGNQSQANQLYYSSVSASFYRPTEPIASREEVHTWAGRGSNVSIGAAIGCIAFCAPATPALVVTSKALGVVEAVTSDAPIAAILAEGIGELMGIKVNAAGEIVKIANKVDDKLVDGVVESTSHLIGENMTNLMEEGAKPKEPPPPPPPSPTNNDRK